MPGRVIRTCRLLSVAWRRLCRLRPSVGPDWREHFLDGIRYSRESRCHFREHKIGISCQPVSVEYGLHGTSPCLPYLPAANRSKVLFRSASGLDSGAKAWAVRRLTALAFSAAACIVARTLAMLSS
jgi:hypothetical protein